MDKIPPWVSSGPLQPRRHWPRASVIPSDPGEALVWVLLLVGVVGVLVALL